MAVTVDNGALHRGEAEGADEIAKALGIRHQVITLEPLNLLEVKQNDPQRCYYCKRLIFGHRAAWQLIVPQDGDGRHQCV